MQKNRGQDLFRTGKPTLICAKRRRCSKRGEPKKIPVALRPKSSLLPSSSHPAPSPPPAALLPLFCREQGKWRWVLRLSVQRRDAHTSSSLEAPDVTHGGREARPMGRRRMARVREAGGRPGEIVPRAFPGRDKSLAPPPLGLGQHVALLREAEPGGRVSTRGSGGNATKRCWTVTQLVMPRGVMRYLFFLSFLCSGRRLQ